MKKTIAALLALGLGATLYAHEHPAGKGAEHPTAKTQEHPTGTQGQEHPTAKAGADTATGEVLDLACFLGHGGKGKDHAKCAIKCIKEGTPVGLLTSDGQVFLVLEDHNNTKPYQEIKKLAAQTVTVTGKILKNGGLQAIQIAKVEKSK